MVPAFPQCDSHPGRLLTNHLLDVADRLRPHGVLLPAAGLFHDLAKGTEYFQRYLRGQPIGDPALKAHAHLGALWLLQFLWSKAISGSLSVEDVIGSYMMVACHHTGLKNAFDSLPPTDDTRRQRWATQLQAIGCPRCGELACDCARRTGAVAGSGRTVGQAEDRI
jgi:CRISPR-associated endonuclease Cas3-HD